MNASDVPPGFRLRRGWVEVDAREMTAFEHVRAGRSHWERAGDVRATILFAVALLGVLVVMVFAGVTDTGADDPPPMPTPQSVPATYAQPR